MPITPTYPGVYIEEIASGVHTITGVATSIAAFVDYFGRGPLNKAVQIFSLADFERAFGGLDTNSEASYAISQFFLNGGSEAYVVRVVGSKAATAAVVVRDAVSGGKEVFRAFAGQMLGGASIKNPGAWGNYLRVEVDYNASDSANFFNLTISEIDASSSQLKVLRSETYRNLSMQAGSANYALDVVNDASVLIQLERDAGWTSTSRPSATGTVGANLPIPAKMPVDKTFKVGVGTTPTIVCTLDYKGSKPTDYPSLRPFIEDAIRTAAAKVSTPDPLLTGATVSFIGKGTTAAPYQFVVLAGRGVPAFDPTKTISFDNDVGTTAADLGLKTANFNVQQYTLGKSATSGDFVLGKDDPAIAEADLEGVRKDKTGLYALEDVDLFNILCLPAIAAASFKSTDFAALIAKAEGYCEERRAFLLVDIPPNVNSLAAMQTWMSQNDSLRHKNAAVYFPRPMIPDPLNNNRLRSISASGTIAGLFARTDANRGVWKAPAGVEASLRNVQDLGYILTDPENGALNPLGVNCLRRFPIYGPISWGARTLDGSDQQASDWKYVPVRRLALFLEESLFRGTKWVVFEPNDEPLWAQIRLNLGAFMHNLFRQGAFQGKTPRQAYLVKCDSETTTQNDIDLGVVNILVGFAPLKPAEFVIIKIQQLAGQIEV